MFRRRSRRWIRVVWLLVVVALACLLVGLAGLEHAADAAYGCAIAASAALALGGLPHLALRGRWRR